MKNSQFRICRLLSRTRAIIDVDDLCRVQLMPSGRIEAELMERSETEAFCRSYNACMKGGRQWHEQAVTISYEDVFTTNRKLHKRLKKGGAA
jgi:hypothetical protein